MDTLINIANLFIVLFLTFYVSRISQKSRQVISKMGQNYHFDIIYGPSAEEILYSEMEDEWSPLFGFEVAPLHEPDRERRHTQRKFSPKGRRAISYVFFPDHLTKIIPKGGERQLYPSLSRKDDYRKNIENFLSQDDQLLCIDALIYKTERGSVHAYFGGGKLYSFGDTWKISIVYDCVNRTGEMVLTEE